MAAQKKDTTEILAQLKEYIGKDGQVAFEHGFRRPTLKIEGYKYKCTMVGEKVMYGFRYYPTGDKRSCNYSLSRLNYSALKTLFDSIKKYEEYCKKEA